MTTDWVCPTCGAEQQTEDTDVPPVCSQRVEAHRSNAFTAGIERFMQSSMVPSDDR